MLRVSMFAVLALCACPALAKDRPLAPSPMVTALGNCQAVTDSAARLACYDRAAPALVGAARSGEITVVDRASVRQARRSMFGFASSALSFLGGGSDNDPAPTKLESKITRWSSLGNGFYRMTIAEENAVWESTESAMMRDAKPGEPVVISRSGIGGYWAKVGKQRELRVRRVR